MMNCLELVVPEHCSGELYAFGRRPQEVVGKLKESMIRDRIITRKGHREMRYQSVMKVIIMIERILAWRQVANKQTIEHIVYVVAGIYFRIIIVGRERSRFDIIFPFPFEILCPGDGWYIGERQGEYGYKRILCVDP